MKWWDDMEFRDLKVNGGKAIAMIDIADSDPTLSDVGLVLYTQRYEKEFHPLHYVQQLSAHIVEWCNSLMASITCWTHDCQLLFSEKEPELIEMNLWIRLGPLTQCTPQPPVQGLESNHSLSGKKNPLTVWVKCKYLPSRQQARLVLLSCVCGVR